jgi:hypothetical protein
MKKFLNKAIPGYSAPSRFTIKRKINEKYKKFKKSAKAIFANIKDFAITTDMWKNKRLTHFLNLSIHYFDDDFNYVSLTASFRKFIGRHQAPRIKKFIQSELTKLGLTDKVRGAATDNGSDTKKACKDLFDRFSCFCHNLNLIVQSLLKFKYNDDLNSISCSSDSENEVDHVNNSDYYDTEPNETDNELDDEDKNEIVDETSIKDLLKKIRKLIKLVKKSSVICSYVFKRIKEIRIENVYNFISDFHVRWNSTYFMLRRLLKLKTIANDLCSKSEQINGLTAIQQSKLADLQLINTEWSVIEDLTELLLPFYKCTKILSGSNYFTLSHYRSICWKKIASQFS